MVSKCMGEDWSCGVRLIDQWMRFVFVFVLEP
jgi:hypothetical protein